MSTYGHPLIQPTFQCQHTPVYQREQTELATAGIRKWTLSYLESVREPAEIATGVRRKGIQNLMMGSRTGLVSIAVRIPCPDLLRTYTNLAAEVSQSTTVELHVPRKFGTWVYL